jgi:glycosyltransferase involved in cell wall biosynthesis
MLYELELTQKFILLIFFKGLFFLKPVKVAKFIFFLLQNLAALIIFFEFPLVLIHKRISPVFPNPSINLEKILTAHRTEVVHFPYQRLFSTRVPSIFEPWDLQHRHLPENFSREEIEFRDWLYRRGCYGANVVVTATHWTKQDLVQTYAVPPEKIAVVYRGAPQFSAFQIRSYRNTVTGQKRLGIRTPYLIYPAKTWPHKNHVRLFQALAVLKNMGQDVSLVCTGTVLKINRDSLENLIAELGLKSSIHLVDHLPDGEFLPLLKQARGLVFPSLFEGLGIPVLEAMALVLAHAHNMTRCGCGPAC